MEFLIITKGFILLQFIVYKTMRKGCTLILKKAKKSGMDEDRARYVDIEQMVKRDLRDAERAEV